MVHSTVVEKYLRVHAELDATNLSFPARKRNPISGQNSLQSPTYQNGLVIPAHRESADSLLAVCQRIHDKTSLLVVIVINSSEAESEAEAKLFRNLIALGSSRSINPDITLVEKKTGPDLLLIDRFSRGRTIDHHQGVGLARKIGADIMLKLWHTGHIASPWLHNTDADAVLPSNYFDIMLRHDGNTLLRTFYHSTENLNHAALPDEQTRDQIAAALYDLSLLYYPAGLRKAGSPYGFPTIGSTLSCKFEAYAHVRGFPKRNAAEDFYMLNKLRKLGPVLTPNGPPIILSSRRSARVPIGTGRAIERIATLNQPIKNFRFEHPDCFKKLKEFLEQLHDCVMTNSQIEIKRNSTARLYLEKSGLNVHLEKLFKRTSRKDVHAKFISDWFDALRTRQFIHQVRDTELGTLSLIDLANYFGVNESAEQSLVSLRQKFADQIYQ